MMDVGSVLNGAFRLEDVLGQGGMGRVWLATDIHLLRKVAVKEVIVPDELDPIAKRQLYARCFKEARNAARLSHPDIVTIYQVLTHEDRPWIVMQYLDLPTLRHEMQSSGPLAPAALREAACRLIETVGYMHLEKIFHRDIKPDNLMVRPDGSWVVLDFGIARHLDDTVTVDGARGTVAYMAPEYLQTGVFTEAGDAWSLGATLCHAALGFAPFQRETTFATMNAILHDAPPPLEGDSVLAQVVAGLLEKDPGRRMTLMEALVLLRKAPPLDVEVLADAKTIDAPAREEALVPTRRFLTRRRAAGISAAVVAALVATIVATSGDGDDRDKQATPEHSASASLSPSASPSVPASSSPSPAANGSVSPSASSSSSGVLLQWGTYKDDEFTIRLEGSYSFYRTPEGILTINQGAYYRVQVLGVGDVTAKGREIFDAEKASEDTVTMDTSPDYSHGDVRWTRTERYNCEESPFPCARKMSSRVWKLDGKLVRVDVMHPDGVGWLESEVFEKLVTFADRITLRA